MLNISVHQLFTKNSPIGCGDSMVARMVSFLAKGSYSEMAKYGVACGTVATMTPGSELCYKKDVEKLYPWILNNPKKS